MIEFQSVIPLWHSNGRLSLNNNKITLIGIASQQSGRATWQFQSKQTNPALLVAQPTSPDQADGLGCALLAGGVVSSIDRQ